MTRLAFLIWVIAAPTLMGMLVTVTLVVPYFMNNQALWIPVAAGAGAVIAAPVSYMIAVAISNATRAR